METNWKDAFTKRELDEIRFASEYALNYNHGTDGHNAKIIIAKMAALLDFNGIKNIPPFSIKEQKKNGSD